MLKALSSSGQVLLIAQASDGEAVVNHYIVEPEADFLVSDNHVDIRNHEDRNLIRVSFDVEFKKDNWPQLALQLMHVMRDQPSDGEGKLDPTAFQFAKSVVAIFGKGNYIFDLNSPFVFPNVLADAYLDYFLEIVADEDIPYFVHNAKKFLH
jgi:hypothetical protein